MSKPGAYDDYITALQEIGASLEAIDAAVFAAVKNALAQWVEDTAVDAIDLLNRPNWLLSQFISSKVIEYLRDAKVQAMAGFRYRDKANRFKDGKETHTNARGKKVREYIPDPGFYGRYFEGGQRKGGAPYSTRARFMRAAKNANIEELKTLIDKAFDEAKRELLAGKIDELKQARKNAGNN